MQISFHREEGKLTTVVICVRKLRLLNDYLGLLLGLWGLELCRHVGPSLRSGALAKIFEESRDRRPQTAAPPPPPGGRLAAFYTRLTPWAR